MPLLEHPKEYSKSARQGYIAIAIIITGMKGLSLFSNYQRRSLLENKKIGNAIVYEITKPNKGGYSARFGFANRGNIYKSSYSLPQLRSG